MVRQDDNMERAFKSLEGKTPPDEGGFVLKTIRPGVELRIELVDVPRKWSVWSVPGVERCESINKFNILRFCNEMSVDLTDPDTKSYLYSISMDLPPENSARAPADWNLEQYR